MNDLYEITIDGFETLLEKREAIKQSSDDLENYFVQREPYQVEGNIAFINIFGPLVRKASEFESKTGITSYEQITDELKQAENDYMVEYVVLGIDSPGGAAMGSEEVADLIGNFPKPIYAIVEGTCASAAYKLASAATLILATKSSQIGSIGSIVIIDSTKKMMNAAGVIRNIFRNADAIYKGLGQDFGELTEFDKEYIQNMVNDSGNDFKELVKRNRPEIADEVFSAMVYKSQDAITVGLIDGIITK